MNVRPVTPKDAAAWLTLRNKLWPTGAAGHRKEIAAFFRRRWPLPAQTFLAFINDEPVGLAEVTIRPYAEGCDTSRVGYLEGWYVLPNHRRRGIGAALLEACEVWARRQNCKEFASDTELKNRPSQKIHHTLGFTETDRIVCYRKEL